MGMTIAGEALLETGLRRAAHGVKPAADIHLGMRFAAVMPGSSSLGSLRSPSLHSEFGISTSNHEPVDGMVGHQSTDFTLKFLQRRHVRSVS